MHDRYETRLTRERADTLIHLGARSDTGQGPVTEDDFAQAANDEWVATRLSLFEYKKLKLVNEALERLAYGGYGVCSRCGGPIPARRLEALPWAKHCVPCQEAIPEEDLRAALSGDLGA